MCFYNDDCDWYAEVVQTEAQPIGPATKCMECRKPIAATEWRKTVHMEQHDDPTCEECYGETYDPPCGECGGTGIRGPGVVYDYVRCLACDRVLEAIEAVEVAEGCPPDARQPALQTLREELRNMRDEAKKYTEEALRRWPELAAHVADLMA